MASSNTTEQGSVDLRKARLWERFVAGGTPPEAADILTETIPPELDGLFLGQPQQTTVSATPQGGLGRLAGLTARSFLNAAGDVGGVVAGSPALGGPLGPGVVGALTQKMGDVVGLPQPETPMERLGTQTLRGAVGGGPLGIPGAVGGALGGLSQQGTAELGFGPLAQLVAGIVGGAVGGKGGMALERRWGPQNRAANAVAEPYRRAGDNPTTELSQAGAVARGDPTLLGYEAMGRPGQQIAQRVAQEGGTSSAPLIARTADNAENIANQARLRQGELAGREAVAQSRRADAMTRRTQALARQARAGFTKRLQGLFGRTAGKEGGLAAEEALRAEYKPRVDAAYEQARWMEVDVTPEMAELLADPTIQRNLAEARAAFNTGVVEGETGVRRPVRQIPDLWVTADDGTVLRGMDGNPVLRDRLPVAVFDEAKKLLDRKLGSKTLAEDRGSVTNALDRIMAVVEDHVDPQTNFVYRDTRALGQEAARARDALAYGRDLRNVRVRTQTRGQVEARKPGQGEDVVEARLAQMTPRERALARAGRIYSIMEISKKSPDPWKAIGDLEQHAPFFTPEEMGELYAARGLAERTKAGVGDARMESLKAEGARSTVEARMARDPQMQGIMDRAEGANQILSANTPRAMQQQANKAKAILVDLLIRANRSAIRDLQTADQSKIMYPPSTRAELANLLSLRGPEFAQRLQQMSDRAAYQRTGVGRGVVAAGVREAEEER